MFHSRVATIVLSILCLWLLLVAVGAGIRHAATVHEVSVLQDRIDSGTRDNARLAEDLDRMKQPAWLALLARERLNYKRPDENVVFVYKSNTAATIVPSTPQDTTPNWKKWLHWLEGK